MQVVRVSPKVLTDSTDLMGTFYPWGKNSHLRAFFPRYILRKFRTASSSPGVSPTITWRSTDGLSPIHDGNSTHPTPFQNRRSNFQTKAGIPNQKGPLNPSRAPNKYSRQAPFNSLSRWPTRQTEEVNRPCELYRTRPWDLCSTCARYPFP